MKKVWGIFWTITALLGGFALWCTWQLPSESKNAFLLGMSKSRLALCAGIAVLILVSLTGAVTAFLSKKNPFTSGKAAGTAAYFITFGLILAGIFLQPPVGRTALERSILERITPIIYWGCAFVFMSIIALLILKGRDILSRMKKSINAFIWGGIALLLMAAAFLTALLTGIGLDPISGTFYRQGVSLLEAHLVLPLLFLYPLIPLIMFFRTKTSGRKAEKVLTLTCSLIIWAAAVWLWQTTKFEGRSYFAPALRPPNYNYYPASDAENYDLLAQSILLGNGFRNGMTVVRPLYAAFLALLHVIFGNDYIRLTNGQILVLALIPVIVFLIGKHLHFPAAGLAAAAWVIWREIYSIKLTPLVQVSNSRLLMSDLPTFLLTSLVIYYAVRWFQNGKESLNALLCGGMIGTAMLIRTQCFVFIPAMIMIILCSRKKPSIKWLSILIGLLAAAIVFCPWTIWNRIHPNTTANAEVSEGQYLQQLYRNAAGETDKNADLWQVISKHPSETLQAIGSHFLNNEISSVLILPMRLVKPEEAEQLFYEGDLFWYRENARETIEKNIPLLSCYLLIICIGIAGTVRKNGFAGLTPLVFHLVYNLGNAFAMTSGFRFLLPSDWILLVYFAMGCTDVLKFFNCLFLFSFQQQDAKSLYETKQTEGHVPAHAHGWGITGAILFLAVIGSVLPLCETVIPRRFPVKSQAQLEVEWIQSSEGATIDLSQYGNNEIVFFEGRAFYPRFYKAGEGDSGGSSSAKRGLDTDRMVWMFHDQSVHVLNCPLTAEQVQSMSETTFQDPMDVLVVGIPKSDYIEVLEMRNK
ncbi:MAG: glycosyltransferase family 39 protein [Anaerolineaceae bacterium]|nr:glycosyltransferase family 39 protein [Anaerolineaceae bacterium]